MSLKTIRLIECDGLILNGKKRCRNTAEVEHGGIRHTRYVLKVGGWKRVRRGQSMIDLCSWCANPKRMVI